MISAEEMLLCLAPVIAIVPAAVTDTRTQKIPNIITFPMMLIGLSLTAIFNRGDLIECLLTMIVLFIIGASGIMGLGDIKLLMGIASVCGALFTAVVIGSASIMVLIKELAVNYKETCGYVTAWIKVILRQASSVDGHGRKIPMGIYILAGYAVAVTGRMVFRVI